MTNPWVRRLSLATVVVAVAVAWSAYLWHYAHPRFATRRLERPDYAIDIPSNWSTELDYDPAARKNGDLNLSPGANPRNREWAYTIILESTGTTMDSWTAREHADPQASPIEEVRLDNGLVAKTWTDVMSMVEVGYKVRNWGFAAPNGRVYACVYAIPSGPVERARLDNTMRRVFGSMKFKER